VDTVEPAAALSFMYALERGIEAEFQLEDSELASELLPDPEDRGRVLYIESAEGGAGVLRRLVEEEDGLRRAAAKALEICHFDAEGNDLGGYVDQRDERCAKACYDCLLSYGNQGKHLQIDRHLARDLLLACARATTTKPGGRDLTGAWESVQEAVFGHRARMDFVSWLREMEYRCPDEVGVALPEYGAVVDLAYRLKTGPVAVFVDGPDDGSGPGRDDLAEDTLRDAGWFVIRVPHGATYSEIVKKYPSVFGTSRRGDR
jgi:hypothetical protein